MAWAHPDVGLSELVQQAGAFLDILSVASGNQSDGSSAVWNAEGLRKALGWASYFEQVLKRLPLGKEGEASKQTLDSALDALLAAVPLPPGIPGLSSSLLANARSLLVQVLVQALPIQNAWLVAKFVESDGSDDWELWDVLIREMSERCMAFGSVRSLQQALGVAIESGKSRTVKVPKSEIWKSSVDSFGFEAPICERWANEALMYITSAQTIHKFAGATLIFNASQGEWTQVLDSLQSCPHPERPIGIKTEIAELCCLFLASPRWKELPRKLLHPACKSFSGKWYKDCWVGRNSAQIGPCKESITSQVREAVEDYLQNLLTSTMEWWKLAPIVLAAALVDSAVVQEYVRLVGKRLRDASTLRCPLGCPCQTCREKSDAQARAWCLLVLHTDCGSDLAMQLHNMLEASSCKK